MLSVVLLLLQTEVEEIQRWEFRNDKLQYLYYYYLYGDPIGPNNIHLKPVIMSVSLVGENIHKTILKSNLNCIEINSPISNIEFTFSELFY